MQLPDSIKDFSREQMVEVHTKTGIGSKAMDK
jgi:hypothetical protein